jgi:cysteinyl-tRNA synthetase
MEYLGETFDLHLGGEDLIFPHHECEIAQAESLTGKPLARYWVHTRFLLIEGEKMSKSKGNFFTVRELIFPPEAGGQGIDPMALRYALISGKYREPLNFTKKHLADSLRIVQRYQEAAQRVEAALKSNRPGPDRLDYRLSTIYDKTLAALCDDLNTPVALAAALEGVKLILGFGDQLNRASAESAHRWLQQIDALLGFVYPPHSSHLQREKDPFVEKVERLLAERDAARRARDFARADAIREQLLQLGVEVMDTPEGTRWRRKVLV